MATTGAVNGTGVFVAMDEAVPGVTYVQIGGQNSHTLTINNGLIDLTNKTSAQVRELLSGEGIQSLDLSLDLVFNSEVTFAALKALAGTRVEASFEIDVSGALTQFVGIIASWAETSPDGDKLSAAVSIQSSGPIVWA